MKGTSKNVVPREFHLDRTPPPGKYPLLEIFKGLTETPPFADYPGDATANRALAGTSWARIHDGPGYIYVAPREVPIEVRSRGYEMLTSGEEEIVIARTHLTESPLIDVYLDVLHEFLHLIQRKEGRNLWPGLSVAYVDRPTELEAYAFSVAEARRLGLSDAYLRKYLEVFWVTKTEYRRLLRHLGVSLPKPRSRRTPNR